MTIPASPIELLMQQPQEVQLNALLDNYLHHHPDSVARSVVEKAIGSADYHFKMKILILVLNYG
jgi:hypothetical protein